MRIFVAGPQAISCLGKKVMNRLNNIYKNGFTVLVGDAAGVDKSVQQHFLNLGYQNIVVFASEGRVRNNLGGWPVKAVPVPKGVRGFDFYATKDKAMADNADYGFMVWNGTSRGTRANIVNLLNQGKKVLVYLNHKDNFFVIDDFNKFDNLIKTGG